MAADLGVSFQLSANAAGMSEGINAGVVELKKLGYAAKQTAGDVRILTGLQLGQAFVSAVRGVADTFSTFARSAASSIDQTDKLSRSLGIAFDQFRVIQLAADLSGASAEQLAQAFTKTQLTILAASKNAPQAAASIRSLGLSVQDLAGLSASDQFVAVAQAIAGIENPAQRTAAAVDIFGKSGAQLVPVFQELAGNIQKAESFFGAFKSQLSAEDAGSVKAVKDAFEETRRAIIEVAGQILAKLSPALTAGARSVTTFLQGLDISAVAASAEGAIQGLTTAAEAVGSAFSIAYQVLEPLARTILPPIADLLGFIANNLQGAAIGAGAAAFALGAYTVASVGASAATAALSTAITALLSRTGVGLIAVVFGSLAAAAIQYGLKGTDAAKDVADAQSQATAQVAKTEEQYKRAGVAAQQFGAKVQAAVKIPNLSLGDIAQDSINAAQSAIAGLAKELGGTINVPRELVAQFNSIQNLAERANGDFVNQRVLLTQLVQESNRFADAIRAVSEQRQADTRAAEQAAEAARKAAEEARSRTADLAFEGLGGAEQSRLKLAEDLLAIDRERRNAEQALAAARAANDNAGIAAARERLGLVRDAAATAREQDRQRQLQALGIDNNLLQPAKTIADQFEALRDAANRGLLNPAELQNAVRNIAQEGLNARREIAQELSRPSQQALQVSDLRSGQGISQFLQAGRTDESVKQREQQLRALRDIKQAIKDQGLQNVVKI